MQHIENLRLRVQKACKMANREPSEVKVLAVGKKHPPARIRELYLHGQRAFGENQLQEARRKQEELLDLDIEWHYIGHVQSNKTRDLAKHFDWVQSVDREKILKRLAAQRPTGHPALNICLQVNIDREPQKSGLLEEEVLAMADLASDQPGIAFRGLMAIPRASADPRETGDSFGRVKAMYDDLRVRGFPLDTLSMGMSSDLETAIENGSTMIRIGTDLFGPRP